MKILTSVSICLMLAFRLANTGDLSSQCTLENNKTVLTCSGLNGIPYGTLENTKIVNFSNNNFTTLKRHIFQSRGFQKLDIAILRFNDITNIEPAAFRGLSKLLQLDLNGNNITKLTKYTFSGLVSLQSLHLRRNRILSLSDDIFQLIPFLDVLDLSHNLLTKLPRTLLSDGSITHLDVSENPLVFEENEPILSSKYLIKLFMRSCNLKALPLEGFGELPNLNELDLSKNELFELPDGLLNPLTDLKNLDISENLIIQLEISSFSSLKALTVLNCEGNLFHISQDCSSFLPMISSSTSVTETAMNVTAINFSSVADTNQLPNLVDQFDNVEEILNNIDDDDDQVEVILKISLYTIGIISAVLVVLIILEIGYLRYKRTRVDEEHVYQEVL